MKTAETGKQTEEPFRYIGKTKVGLGSYAVEAGASTIYFRNKGHALLFLAAPELFAVVSENIDRLCACRGPGEVCQAHAAMEKAKGLTPIP